MSGTLYLIPNTLGANTRGGLPAVLPEDVRAVAAGLKYFVGEQAKSTRAFLKLVGVSTPIQEIDIRELNVNTPEAAIDALLAPILAGADGGLVSEAGCPAVADPGALLVRRAHEKGVRVVPFVGPSSILLALMASGLNGQSFAFHGYLPTDAAERAKRLRELEQRSRKEKQTQIFIETPYRNKAMLDALLQHCDASTLLCVAVDVTQDDEQIVTHRVRGWPQARMELHKRPAIFLFLAQ
ncbi:SAM-dependent methyltransferase [Pandoraea pulmonicola]|uniref:Ribosomal RNA small subunit methyltransferase I n=1 Tax=Pandoraea pulmonicola TaxID=93221 RepID=A0AAJ4ZEJ4_PANPU|nr:SAM-dependent methyltransferase [Pandoraea pulmonicola]AJC19884.1 SAM-dependent methyltransferase [Pandoraea pulmonicola]SUA91917.1 Ribosomal RNA small subunit methyltransferase I [Pandoraea pulmonicola]